MQERINAAFLNPYHNETAKQSSMQPSIPLYHNELAFICPFIAIENLILLGSGVDDTLARRWPVRYYILARRPEPRVRIKETKAEEPGGGIK